MKIQSVLRLALFPCLTCVSFGANLAFPVSGVINDDPLDGSWSQSDGVASGDKLAWYSTIGSPTVLKEGVSVGAYFDDYADIATGDGPPGDGGFTVGHATSAVAVGGATIDWYFAISAPTGLYSTTLNDYSISLLDTGSNSVLTIDLTYDSGNQWQAFANGVSFGFIDNGGLYSLQASFGAVSGYSVSIIGDGTITYTDALFNPTALTFGSVVIGTTEGAGNSDFGDGFITVVPEPSAALLGAFGVLGLLRRRR